MIGRTLFQRFFVRVLAGLSIAFLVFLLLVHLFQLRVVDREWREDLRQEAVWLGRHTPLERSAELASAWRTMHDSVRLATFDRDGRKVADSHPERPDIDLASLRAGRKPFGWLTALVDVPGGGSLVMSRPYVPSFPAGMRGELALASLLILGPMVALLYPLARSMRRTLRDLGGAAEQVASGQFGRTLEVERDDELGTLVRAFNDMSLKLAEAERLNSRLLHDVSHELRSPLGRIQALSDTIAARPGETAECLRAIGQEVRLLDRLVEDLLQAARLEGDAQRARRERFWLLHWAEETAARLAPGTRAAGIAWSVALPLEDVEVEADPMQLAQALSNLVDNSVHALRGRAGARIDVTFARAGERWTLSVADNGPGIPHEHLPHVFRRFYRADEHRDRDSGGVGLGLSLVRAIAEAHGGAATIESEPGRGTRVTLALPLEDAAPGAA